MTKIRNCKINFKSIFEWVKDEMNDEETRADLVIMCQSIDPDWDYTCDTTNNFIEDIDRGKLVLDVIHKTRCLGYRLEYSGHSLSIVEVMSDE